MLAFELSLIVASVKCMDNFKVLYLVTLKVFNEVAGSAITFSIYLYLYRKNVGLWIFSLGLVYPSECEIVAMAQSKSHWLVVYQLASGILPFFV